MNKISILMQFHLLILLIIGSSMAGCSSGSVNWQEEVKLNDGQIIVIDREAIYVGGGDEWASNRRGGKIDEYRIRFASSNSSDNIIEWQSTKKDFQTYPEIPLIFDLPAGEPTVYSLVAISSGCEVYSKYVYRNGVWVEQDLPEQFEELKTNLLFASKRDLPKLLNMTEKLKRNSEPGHRQALMQIGPARKVCG